MLQSFNQFKEILSPFQNASCTKFGEKLASPLISFKKIGGSLVCYHFGEMIGSHLLSFSRNKFDDRFVKDLFFIAHYACCPNQLGLRQTNLGPWSFPEVNGQENLTQSDNQKQGPYQLSYPGRFRVVKIGDALVPTEISRLWQLQKLLSNWRSSTLTTYCNWPSVSPLI